MLTSQFSLLQVNRSVKRCNIHCHCSELTTSQTGAVRGSLGSMLQIPTDFVWLLLDKCVKAMQCGIIISVVVLSGSKLTACLRVKSAQIQIHIQSVVFCTNLYIFYLYLIIKGCMDLGCLFVFRL